MTSTIERDEATAPPVRRRSRWRSMLVVTLLVSVGLVAAGVLPIQQYLERENEVQAARERLDALVDRNAALSGETEALLSEEEIERVAREQYGFVRPGEVGYVVIVPEADSAASGSAEPEPEPAADDRSLLQRIWDFIAGNDQPVDG